MSTNIQAHDLSLNVRYSKRDKRNRRENEDSQVVIYDNEDTQRQSRSDLGSNKVTVKRSPFRATAVIMGVLYLLILAGIYTRYILATLEKQNVVTERDQLNISLNQAQTRIINLTAERDELQTRYDILGKRYSQLEDERNRWKRMVMQLKERVSSPEDLYMQTGGLSPL